MKLVYYNGNDFVFLDLLENNGIHSVGITEKNFILGVQDGAKHYLIPNMSPLEVLANNQSISFSDIDKKHYNLSGRNISFDEKDLLINDDKKGTTRLYGVLHNSANVPIANTLLFFHLYDYATSTPLSIFLSVLTSATGKYVVELPKSVHYSFSVDGFVNLFDMNGSLSLITDVNQLDSIIKERGVF
ncbi:hypothetical protein [Changchengzhania lutea]|uniref:hypothetical protein n=1 Tax=Changchengzhania lutea TaxID=2049305 RepID=UPI00115EE845|nr:hypothetical protein [Changchengzhania lutea]